MSGENPQMPLEEVLLAFAAEPVHDRAALERYVKLHPEFSEDLVDMLHELRLEGRGMSESAEDESAARRGFEQLVGASASPQTPSSNPFATFRGQAFADLAARLRVPRSLRERR